MKRLLIMLLLASPALVYGQGDGGYRLVPNWAKLPPGMYFGLKEPPPPPAEREAQAAARRARGSTLREPQGRPEQGRGATGSGRAGEGGATNQPGISGLAIDAQDHIYVFNRGPKPVMVFDRDGNLIRAGADQEINGKKINPSWQHSGGVDWDGNVYVIERDAHRIVKLSPKLDQFLLQLGTTNEKGNDATHFNLPSGIAILRNGNLIVTDGYGNNRVVMFDKNGKFIKQVGKGAGGPDDKGTGSGEWHLPHKLAVDAEEHLYIIDRENHRLQMFDRNLNYLREIKNDWNPWDVGISRKGNDGIGFIADHKDERVQKFSLKDGKILATWGKPGWGPGEFDWVHGVVVDSKGAVYAADTYGQRLQKFVPAATGSTAALAPLATSGSPARKGAQADRPNIVFILSDDQAHNALGIAGHPHLKTPNLDRLAREGAWLRQAAVVTPLCAPSRAAFLTGLYGHTSGVRSNTMPWPERFPPSFLSVAKEAGYRTAFIGKKHIYNTDDPLPGVDRWVSFVNQGWFVNPEMNIDGDRRKLTGANGDLLTDFALEFIRANRQAPFAMVVAYKEAHSQQTAPPRFDSMFERVALTLPATWNEDKSTKPAFFVPQPNIPDTGFAEPNPRANDPLDQTKRDELAVKKIRNYYRCVAALDDYVGRIRQALEETGRLDNTILVFGGDNGYFLGDHGRFEKMTPHEESVRIPLLMRFPAAIRPATVSDELVLNIDLAPTLYDLAGLKSPAPLDGRSLRPIFEGRGRARNWRQETYIEWQGAEGRIAPGTAGYIFRPEPPRPGAAAAAAPPIPTWRALRTRDYKYSVYLNGDLSELYDLRSDPRETRNLINDPKAQKRIAALHRRLLEAAHETRDPLKDLIPSSPSRTRLVRSTAQAAGR